MDIHTIPPALREIPDAPKKLYVRGKLPDPSVYYYLTIVGSRKYSTYGKDVCKKLIAGLQGYPIVIVSGLALGMDTIVHTTALEHNILTVAVPGSGISDEAIYPASNRSLARMIIAKGGALISEYEPDQRAAQWTFPRRNRIMAGISRATLIIEATEGSGTRITARLATEYNRDVLAVPGSIFSENSVGCHALIREGATPITNTQDILQALGFANEHTPVHDDSQYDNCTDDEKKVLSLLASPQTRGDVIRELSATMNTSQASVLLSSMEIKGFITESMGELRRVF